MIFELVHQVFVAAVAGRTVHFALLNIGLLARSVAFAAVATDCCLGNAPFQSLPFSILALMISMAFLVTSAVMRPHRSLRSLLLSSILCS